MDWTLRKEANMKATKASRTSPEVSPSVLARVSGRLGLAGAVAGSGPFSFAARATGEETSSVARLLCSESPDGGRAIRLRLVGNSFSCPGWTSAPPWVLLPRLDDESAGLQKTFF